MEKIMITRVNQRASIELFRAALGNARKIAWHLRDYWDWPAAI
jgi:hypothetical protein